MTDKIVVLISHLLVEIRGFEPLTYTLRTYRATNCAISPNFGGNKWARTIDLLHVKQAL